MRYVLFLLLLMFLAACKQKNKHLVGTWKMEEVVINGSKLTFEEIGQPFYTFDEDGKYVLKMNATTEEGIYTLKEQNIVLQPNSALPEQTLRLQEQDSITFLLVSNALQNKMQVKLVKQIAKQAQ